MRHSCDWFALKAKKIWSIQKGRSFLVLVPQGCNEDTISALVIRWCSNNFESPPPYSDYSILPIYIVSDTQLTSHQFATRIAADIRKKCGIELNFRKDDYPTDIIQDSIDAALSKKQFPLLFIGRFHAFASIQDGGMSSVLSQLRTLEMEGGMTTITFSPMTYSAIRKSMEGSHAFLNSVYGDAHEQVVLDPLSRDEFVRHSISLGVKKEIAEKHYSYGGGPDKVFEALANALADHEKDPVAYCASQSKDVIGSFFDRTLAEAGPLRDSMLGSLSMGRLSLEEEAFLKSNPMVDFFAKSDESGRLTCSARILARWILSNRAGGWTTYASCLLLLRSGERRSAATLAQELSSDDPRHLTFLSLVSMVGASDVDLANPFFGMDWLAIIRACQRISHLEEHIPVANIDWVRRMCSWSSWMKAVQRSSRLESDSLTLKADDQNVRQLMLFMVSKFVDAVLSRGDGIQIDNLVKIPEVILQTVAVGHCGIDFSKAPEFDEHVDFSAYFGGVGAFIPPKVGEKITLTGLIVIVPALLKKLGARSGLSLMDPLKVRSLQGSFVDRIRNRSAHAIVDLSTSDRKLLGSVCRDWIKDWATLEGFEQPELVPGLAGQPTIDDLEDLLTRR